MRMGLAIFVLMAMTVSAEEVPKTKAPAATDSSTQHSFEDLLIQGRYHFSDEAVTTVEEDKVLDALIGVRSHFKDRLEQSVERY